MSEYLNRITLVGRAGQEPEVRYFESGAVKASISVAVRPPYKSETPLWFDLTAWGATAEVIANYVKKGTQIAVLGEFSFDRWTDKNSGTMRSKPVVTVQKIELLSSPRSEDKSSLEDKQTANIANANF
ncbi:single-stranded DNA-binding protein [Fischerella thermalis CCMEE 5273]|uniref:Single-stranded DNA-binding protein n=1 Tax=Chlorogloeopsis fritschii PCC 6912 TaxID=211165 RepID=A0A433NLS1_CHLFR|nr:single-stranded DNA-binding protein [Chlorogloeopsis fritschii]PMB06915.1 single-stranded DNA-binding protein [Fischerella thermalis CCMEE 5273]PMB41776.1 single-stranded DNA-binding protein [Fischerella thermalis CCMEE 5205]RUR83843.1 single-stranded DNA-binding protein [Chlorogloeopsis fritschii PCC 6912]